MNRLHPLDYFTSLCVITHVCVYIFRSQQIIPPLYLPHSDKREKAKVKVSHAVDQGDVAFILLTNRMQNLIMASEAPGPRAHAPGRNAFCNLATVNYLLAGLQRLDSSDKPRMCNWAQLAEDMDFAGGELLQ